MQKAGHIREVLRELKNFYAFNTNNELAAFLGIAATTLSSWRSRNTMDYVLVTSKCKEINANWLLTGEGSIVKGENIAEPRHRYSKENCEKCEMLEEQIADCKTEKKRLMDMMEKLLNQAGQDK